MNSIANDLQPGFSILWYEIKSVLGRGGFGITYLARDNNLGHQVAIKEYLPRDFATRSGDSTVQPVSIEQRELFDWGLERFMSEAQTLAQFKHPNIVRVSSVFMQNNTGYMVMDYEQGEVLSSAYKRKKQLTQQTLESIYYPIIHGLSLVHKKGFIHRDIKPSNIYIREDGSPVLIDFGAARQPVGIRTEKLTSMLSIGYAPFEQYSDTPGKQGAWTDIYALGASMYQGVTGKKPVESSVRGEALLHKEADPYKPLSVVSRTDGYSRSFLRAIDQALMIQIQDRPQTLNEFLAMLKGKITLPDLPGEAALPDLSDGLLTGKEPTIGSLGDIDLSDRLSGDIGLPNLLGGSSTEIEPTMIIQKTEIMPRRNKISKVEAKRPGPVPRTAAIERTTSEPLFCRPGVRIFIVTVVAIVFALVPVPGRIFQQDTISQVIRALFEKAESQIQVGRYYDRSGEGALNAYQQILSIDEKNLAAKKGMNRVGLLILKQAQQSMDNNDLVSTGEDLKIISRFVPMLNGLSETQQKYKQRLGSEKKIEVLLDKADIALGKGQVYEPEQENAIFYYQNVIQLDQNNAIARLGLSNISEKLITDAQNEITKKHFTNAKKLISIAETIKPESPSIKNLREKVQKSTQLEQLLAKANTAFKNNHLLVPENNNAYLFYKKVLSLKPSNVTARGRLSRMAGFYAKKVRKNTQSGDITIAKKNLAILDKYFPDYSGLSDLKSELALKENRIKNAESVNQNLTVATTIVTPEENNVQDEFEMKPWITDAEKANQNLAAANTFLPLGINQKQDDFQVVQDIVGQFMASFRSMDMWGLFKVTRLTNEQHALYSGIFKSYESLKITVVPNSFRLMKEQGTGSVKFEISDLIDVNGHPVSSAAGWTNIEIKITRKYDNWLKVEIL